MSKPFSGDSWVRYVLIACIFAWVLTEPVSASTYDPATDCKATVETETLVCINNGTLYTGHTHKSEHCAYCECPDGWGGVDCSVCRTKDVCQPIMMNGTEVEAELCTHDQLFPTVQEQKIGKTYSCACGGDAVTDFLCAMQPNTAFLWTLTGNNSKDSGQLVVEEFAGVPANYNPPYPDRYKYANSLVWTGHFTGCTWHRGSCQPPLADTQSCFFIECDDGIVTCPPDNIPLCPGFPDCETPDGESRPYWQHKCNALPESGKPLVLFCLEDLTPQNRSLCYYMQVGGFGPYAATCETGECIYEAPDIDIPVRPDDSADTQLMVVLIMASVVSFLALFASSNIYITLVRRRNVKRFMGDTALIDVASAPLIRKGGLLTLSWYDLSYTVRSQGNMKVIISGNSGVAGVIHGGNRSSILAVMGPSGAGKTTLLEILSGRKSLQAGTVTGEVRINGRPVTARQLQNIAGYVPQEDVLPGMSTVQEHLLFHAGLRMPPGTKQEAIFARVSEVLDFLGLRPCCDTFIGNEYLRGISGGERRRLSIGIEILTNPAILFLDEPTTGLDSANAAKVVSMLSRLASEGSTIVMAIHQPRSDIFQLIDRVLLLSTNGHIVFSGPCELASAFLCGNNHHPVDPGMNPADHLLDVVMKTTWPQVEDLSRSYRLSPIAKEEEDWRRRLAIEPCEESEITVCEKRRPPFYRQVVYVCGRMLRLVLRHPLLIFINFVSTAFMALCLGFIFHDAGVDTAGIQNRLGVMFFILIFFGLMSLASLPVWKEEHKLVVHENTSGVYSTPAHFIAVFFLDVVVMRVVPPFFFLFSYWMIGLHEGCDECIVTFLAVLILANVVATTTSMTIGALGLSNAVANVLGSLVVLVFMLFAGFLLNKEEMPSEVAWISDVSYMNYALEALAVNEFHDTDTIFVFTSGVDPRVLPDLRVQGDQILQQFGFDPDQADVDKIVLAVMILVYLGLTLLLLMYWRPVILWDRVSRIWSGRKRIGPDTVVDEAPLVSGMRAPSLVSRLPNNDYWDPEPPLILSWEDISYRVPYEGGDKTILHGVYGIAGFDIDVADGEGGGAGTRGRTGPCAILGPSGAGKTTLLDILAGRKADGVVAGKVRLNGLEVSPEEMRKLSGYVTQEDVLPATATVFEYLMFQAELRLGEDVDRWHREERVLQLMGDLGLTRVAHSHIGGDYVRGISGGEKRRLSIASELITNPPVLFLDEPTTGLDSSNAAKIVSILARVCECGVTVLLTIHQPRTDVFRLLHGLIVVAKGRVVYSGPASRAMAVINAAGVRPHQPLSPSLLPQSALDDDVRSDGGGRGAGGGGGGGGGGRHAGLGSRTRAQEVHGGERDAGQEGRGSRMQKGQQSRGLNPGSPVPRPGQQHPSARLVQAESVAAAPAIHHENDANVDGDVDGDARDPPVKCACGRTDPEANPADVVMDVVTHASPTELNSIMRAHQESVIFGQVAAALARLRHPEGPLDVEHRSKHLSPRRVQLFALLRRGVRNLLRHPFIIFLHFVATFAVALCLGLIFHDTGVDSAGIQDRFGCMFFMTAYLSFMSLSSLPVWREERRLFVHERASGLYETQTYFGATVLLDLIPLRLIPPLFFLFSYELIGLHEDCWSCKFWFCVVLMLTNLTAAAVAFAVGALAPSTSVANAVGSLIVLFSLLFGGFLLNRDDLPDYCQPLVMLSYINYAFEVLVVNEFHDAGPFWFTSPQDKKLRVQVTGDEVLETFSFHVDEFYVDLCGLTVMAVVFLWFTYVMLRYYVREHR